MSKYTLVSAILFCMFALCATAQTSVTKTRHTKAMKTDQVSKGTVTIRKPDYICIATDGDKDQLIMDGTKFTMVMGGKKHETDSKKNAQFATFQKVLTAIINGKSIPECEDLKTTSNGGEKTLTITPSGKKRKMFSSFVLVVDTKSSTMKTLRMNGRKSEYTEYVFK